mmetsp:Transcript_95590/g.218958  ORF Transcript_95590/g.218958 Transcript_95590/m.218958 type:complete len:101 (-) Transcript_95590:218-520(-)
MQRCEALSFCGGMVRTQKHVTIAETPEVFLVPCLHVSYALPGLENICAAHAQRQREQKRAEEAVQVSSSSAAQDWQNSLEGLAEHRTHAAVAPGQPASRW